MMTDPTEQSEPLKSVTIESQPDGSYMVGTESEGAEMPEGAPGEVEQDASQGMQPAASIDEALNLARQMLQEGEEPSEQVAAENAFTQSRGGR